MSLIRSGDLRHKVTIQAISVATSDNAGGSLKTWTPIANGVVWAKVEPLNGGEAFRQGVINATQFYRVTVRFRGDVSPRHRLIWNGTALNIRTCGDPDGRGEALVMTAESGAGEP